MTRRVACLLIAAAIIPACGGGGSSGGGGPSPVDTNVYFLLDGDLARAFVYNGGWVGGEFLDALQTSVGWVPHRTISGTSVTYSYGVRYITYVRSGLTLWRFDTAQAFSTGTNPRRVSSDVNAASLKAVVDTSPADTTEATTYAFWTSIPVAGLEDFRVAPLSAGIGSAPADIDTDVPAATYTVVAPMSAANYVYVHRVQGTAGTLRRVDLSGFPALTIVNMAGTDDVEEFLVKDHTAVVYRSSTGLIRKCTAGGSPATIFTPGGTETVALLGKINSGADAEIYFSSRTEVGAVDDLRLKRVTFTAGTVTTIDGPLPVTTLTSNRVAFTGARVIWANIRDSSSTIKSYVRSSPATTSDLLTATRSITTEPIYIVYDPLAVAYRVLFAESGSGTTYRILKTEDGALITEHAFSGTPGPTDAVNRMGVDYYDAALDLFAVTPPARLCFVDGADLQSIDVLLSGGSISLGGVPADISTFELATSYLAQTCLAGLAISPAQHDIFYFRADSGGSLLRQMTSAVEDTAIAAH